MKNDDDHHNDTDLRARRHHSPMRLVICGGGVDTRLLLDGLLTQRNPASSTDGAYRAFSTDTLSPEKLNPERRPFIVADLPGHVQSASGIVAAASTADLAVIVVDASQGVSAQARRHGIWMSLLGIRHVVLAVSKMDRVGHDQAVFERIDADYRNSAARGGLGDPASIVAVPLSSAHGNDITAPDAHMPWFQGPTLLQHLEAVAIDNARQRQAGPLRLPVQDVIPHSVDVEAYAGTLASGTVHVGQRVRVQPSGRSSTVARISTARGDMQQAVADHAVTLTLADALHASPGDLISAADSPAEVAGQFNATVVWMHSAPMLPGRGYLLKMGCKTVNATVLSLRHKINVDTLEPMPAERLEQDEIGVVEISVDTVLAFDPYRAGGHTNKATGGLTLVDKISHATAGFGMLNFALRRAHNIHWQTLEVNKAARQRLAGHRSAVLWLTGLSGAGKSTIANLLEQRLHARGVRSYLLDGDNLRHGLNKDLGFTAEARAENIRRVAEVARLMVDAGVVVIAAFISPFRAERRMARELMGHGEFIEVFVDTPLAVAEQRDVKGLYKKARRGELKNFTGIDSPYEAPEAAEVVIDTTALSPADAAALLLERLEALCLLSLD